MTGQYSIRNGLSLLALPGGPNTLPAKAYTMGQLFKDSGYATAMFGKWHLGIAAQSLPGAHGFDEFYGIPPDASWDAAANVPQIMQTQSAGNIPEKDLMEKGPWIYQQRDGPLQVGPARGAREVDTEDCCRDRSNS
jgi:arylsulfatase